MDFFGLLLELGLKTPAEKFIEVAQFPTLI
jgi:hypothetical protein